MENTSNQSMELKQHSISIRFSSDGFSLFVYDINKTVISSKQIQLRVVDLDKVDIVANVLEHVDMDLLGVELSLTYETSTFTVVPASLFLSKDALAFFSFQHTLEMTQTLVNDPLSKLDMVILFSVHTALRDALKEVFPSVLLRHHLSEFIEAIPLGLDSRMHVWVGRSSIESVLVKGRIFQLVNSYPYQTKEDVAYSILAIFEQFQLDVKQTGVQLYGQYATSTMRNLLENYVADVKLTNK
jgi:hypothetical protein